MRRRGIGRALLDWSEAEAGRRRIGSVVLEVAADNEAARRLYGATGFIRVGARPRYYRRGRRVDRRADPASADRSGSRIATNALPA